MIIFIKNNNRFLHYYYLYYFNVKNPYDFNEEIPKLIRY